METNCAIKFRGNIFGCCSGLVPFGNLIEDGELDEIYHSVHARIVKLSSLNRSYCLCNLNRWCKGYCDKGKVMPTEKWETITYPRWITLNFDISCNLICKSCRKKPYVIDEMTREQTTTMVTKLLRSGYLEKTKELVVAGAGEAFYSPYYRQILMMDLHRQQIRIKSNGTLLDENNWRLLEGKYSSIDVNISVDAATAETYQKLRGADFNNLMKNLTMLSDLHRQNKIRKFGLNFVVQRDNFREMHDFVKLGQSLGVSFVQFQRLNAGGIFNQENLSESCLIINNQYLDYDLWCVLQDPIFRDPIVDLRGFQRYIDASEKRYRRRYEREQRHGK